MPSDNLRRAADFIGQRRIDIAPFSELPDGLQPATSAAAYDIQWAVHDWFAARGETFEGWKVGVTSTTMQAYMKMTTPALGRVRQAFVARDHADLARDRYVGPGIELEIVVRLGADLAPSDAPWTRHSVAGAVAALMPGFEIVDDRYGGILEMPASTLIADDFCNAGCILGAEVADWRALDLEAIEGVMTVNASDGASDVRSGRGRDVLGHPLEALAYVANHLNACGKTARAGEIVMLGSLVKTAWLDAGDSAAGEIKGLGKVSLSFV